MDSDQSSPGFFKSIFLTHVILVLHGVLILLFALLVVFFRGVVAYLPWILLGGLLLVASLGLLLWRRFRRSEGALRSLLDNPALRERAFELRFLGGVASLKLGAPGGDASRSQARITGPPRAPARLEDQEAQHLRHLARLIRLRDEGELTEEEFEALRGDLRPDPSPADRREFPMN